jgi:hypothetical protein
MVHLTPAKNIKRISRTGICKNGRGVYCMPVLQDYYTSHQWLRELRRWGPGPFVAVYFRLDDHEIVECGPYWQKHRSLPAAQAVQLLRQQEDAQGWEIFVPRSISSRELHTVRYLPQVLGWRYSPTSHEKPWCHCPVCVSRGEFNSSKKREKREYLTYSEIMTRLHSLHTQAQECYAHEENIQEMVLLLDTLRYRKAGAASDFLFLVDFPSDDVLDALYDLFSVYKGITARRLLRVVTARRELLQGVSETRE